MLVRDFQRVVGIEAREQYQTASDEDCLDDFYTLSRTEGIIPALESAHAVAFAMRWAREHRFSSTFQAVVTRTSIF